MGGLIGQPSCALQNRIECAKKGPSTWGGILMNINSSTRDVGLARACLIERRERLSL
jgi:hypothetical protein